MGVYICVNVYAYASIYAYVNNICVYLTFPVCYSFVEPETILDTTFTRKKQPRLKACPGDY